jgi:uncharacterized protein (TIGR00369 family)
VPYENRGAFTNHNGPIFHRPTTDPALELAMYVLPRHTNRLGVLHGGMLSSFLDVLLGGAVSHVTGQIGMTVHLSVDFLRMARKGEWLKGEGRMTHATQHVAFAEGRVFAGPRLVGRATGVFKLMELRR